MGMGSTRSTNRKKLFSFLPYSTSSYYKYEPLSDDSSAQPLLLEENHLRVGIENDVQANWEKSSALDKEFRQLKSKFSRLEIKVQNAILKANVKTTEGEGKDENHKAIISVKEKNVKTSEAEKQKVVIGPKEKNIKIVEDEKQKATTSDIEKNIKEIKSTFNDMSSTIADLCGSVAKLTHQKELQTSKTTEDYSMFTHFEEIDWLYIIIIFLVGVIIGLKF